MQINRAEIAIVGGGIVGLTLAIALAQQTDLSIVVLEAQATTNDWSLDQTHHRVSAITLASQEIFSRLKVWKSMVEKRVSPFHKMMVWDKTGEHQVSFASESLGFAHLGCIVENNLIQHCLMSELKKHKQIQYIDNIKLKSIKESCDHIVIASEQQQFQVKLAIASDGARSWLRKEAGIQVETYAYDEEAIVVNVETEKSHESVARQIFTRQGPLAFLPLQSPNAASIVWSLPRADAQALLAVDPTTFKHALSEAFMYKLGKVMAVGERFSFPLYKQEAKAYVKSRIVLVGDAAHTVHPLAGQGVNIGLLDAASLVDVITESVEKGRDFSHPQVLARYARWRRADNAPLLYGIDKIKTLFASDHSLTVRIREIGLSLTEQFPMLKHLFMRHAIGQRQHLPKLAEVSVR